jgi:hypothetical protein
MQRRKRLRGLFVSSDGISIRRLRQAPPLLVGLAHPGFARTAVDCARGVAFYEQREEPLRSLAAAYRNGIAESGCGLELTAQVAK